MAKKSRKDRKQAAAKQGIEKQNKSGQNVVVQAAEAEKKVESEKMEAVKVEAQEKDAVNTAGQVSESAVEDTDVICESKEEKESESKVQEETESRVQEEEETESKVQEKKEAEEALRKAEQRAAYEKRFARHFDELKWLYMELYGNSSMFAELCDNLYRFYEERNEDLKEIDQEREACPDWYKKNDLLGMMFYIDNFAGNMKGVESKLDYLEKSNVNYIHLMPFLDTVEGRSDGGYAVADFRKV